MDAQAHFSGLCLEDPTTGRVTIPLLDDRVEHFEAPVPSFVGRIDGRRGRRGVSVFAVGDTARVRDGFECYGRTECKGFTRLLR